MSDNCRSKSRLKWRESEQEARDHCFNRLITSFFHGPANGFDEANARMLADNVEIED